MCVCIKGITTLEYSRIEHQRVTKQATEHRSNITAVFIKSAFPCSEWLMWCGSQDDIKKLSRARIQVGPQEWNMQLSTHTWKRQTSP